MCCVNEYGADQALGNNGESSCPKRSVLCDGWPEIKTKSKPGEDFPKSRPTYQ